MIRRAVKTILIAFFLMAISMPVFAVYQTYAVRINCGGGSSVVSFDDVYITDQEYTAANGAGYTGGSFDLAGSVPIEGTTDDVLYQSDRNGSFNYKFDVPNGYYQVTLRFAETSFTSTGDRVFDVSLEGTVVLDDLDIYAEVGGLCAFDYEDGIDVTDGQLNVEFSASVGSPKLCAISVTKVKPPSTGLIQVNGRQIVVDGQPFTIKGVGYQPIPVGCDLDQSHNVNDIDWKFEIFADPEVYERDLALLREMGCNTIRTWGKVAEMEVFPGGPFTPAYDFLDACWNGGVDPIYVVMGFHLRNDVDYSDDFWKAQYRNEFRDYVEVYQDHPAVLMWSVGNENNYWYAGYKADWYDFVNDLAWAAYEEEGGDYHPVTHSNGDTWIEPPDWGYGPIGSRVYKTDDASMTYLDVWAANIYPKDVDGNRLKTFQGRIPDYATRSRKPFFISEYGVPGDDQRDQAEAADLLWDEMMVDSWICSGSTIMAYSDEWWKFRDPDWYNEWGALINEAALIQHLSMHDVKLLNDGTWDYNEECWGVVAMEDSGAEELGVAHVPDIARPKPAYYILQEKWVDPADKSNLAFGKPALASSLESGTSHYALNAFDADIVTRWSSEPSDPQWLYVDLGAMYHIGKVILRWEAAYALEYEIQVSENAADWTTVYSTSSGDGGADFIYFDDTPVTGRYVRLYGIQRGTIYGYSLWEFEVYEPFPANMAIGKSVTASSIGYTGYEAELAVDNDFDSRWGSETDVDPQWLCVDLGAEYDVSQVVLRWEVAYGKSYQIQKSDNGADWTDVYSTTTSDGIDDYIDFDPPFRARYVRMYGTERGNQFGGSLYGYSLWELEINGVISPPPPVADFTADATSGPAPLTVNFSDMSTGFITSWAWDFGDTGTSAERNPSHTYHVPGAYTVTLTVADGGGSDYETKTDYITAGGILVLPGGSIQDAIDSAAGDETIYIKEGTYTQDISVNGKDDVRIIGDISGATILEGDVSFTDADSSVERLTVLYKGGDCFTYSDENYTDLRISKDAGITAINSQITVRDCTIMPDAAYHPSGYGKGIQILNLYGTDDIAPLLEGNTIQDAHTGILLYSQSSGGAITGSIQTNELDGNTYGIVLRMRKEKPLIDDNVISYSSEDAIHITYANGSLLGERLANISNNDFIGNTRDIFCDELGAQLP